EFHVTGVQTCALPILWLGQATCRRIGRTKQARRRKQAAGETGGTLGMTTQGINRRRFLQGSALATAAVLGSGALAGAARALAAEMALGALDAQNAAGLLVMTRRLYPHDTLADGYYAGVV